MQTQQLALWKHIVIGEVDLVEIGRNVRDGKFLVSARSSFMAYIRHCFDPLNPEGLVPKEGIDLYRLPISDLGFRGPLVDDTSEITERAIAKGLKKCPFWTALYVANSLDGIEKGACWHFLVGVPFHDQVVEMATISEHEGKPALNFEVTKYVWRRRIKGPVIFTR